MRVRATIMGAMLLGLLLVAGGCQSSPRWATGGGRDTRAYPYYEGRAPSLVLDAPRLVRALAQANASLPPGTLPWYAARNDARLTTYAGVQGPTFEVSATWSVDRQATSNGHVSNYYSNTTYRRSVTATSR